ncbi:Uncharacterised protein [uncultured archaeon]|nr:Uncharacterised protein [uncultured archaeon]
MTLGSDSVVSVKQRGETIIIGDLIFWAYLVLVSATLALLEIQIEGANGWAKCLPTWRMENKLTRMIMGGKPLTGYHVFLIAFVVLLAHIPYFLGLAIPSVPIELRLISFIILLFIIEDFLWFVLNPAYGIKKFKPKYIWWHASSWWWIMPRDYYVFGLIGVFLYYISQILQK